MFSSVGEFQDPNISISKTSYFKGSMIRGICAALQGKTPISESFSLKLFCMMM
jgi:hypothetical protein